MSSTSFIARALVIFIFILKIAAASDIPPSTEIRLETACSYTPDPAFCKSFFSNQGAQNLYSYSTYSLSSGLSDSAKFLDSNQHLSSSSSGMSQSAAMALEDCQLMFDLNIDYIYSASSSLKAASSNSALADSQAENLQAMLDVVLTKQQTCLQSLQEAASSTVSNDLSASLSNGTELSQYQKIDAISQLRDTWMNSFKFKPLDISDKEEVRSLNLVVFPGTGILLKTLVKKFSHDVNIQCN